MLQSLAAFATSPVSVQSCLYVIAARTDLPDARQLSDSFLAADVDGTGRISLQELTKAINSAKQWFDPEINVMRLFDAMNLNQSGSVSFTMFRAACSYGTFCSLDDILTTAFNALDERRCGLLSVGEVARLLPRCDRRVMQSLPQDRNFNVDEWVARLQMSSRLTVTAVQPRPRRATAPGLFDRFFCTGCHEEPVSEHVMAPITVLPYSYSQVSCH
jgi:Ca2+-binding EF-hand superfamily protein